MSFRQARRRGFFSFTKSSRHTQRHPARTRRPVVEQLEKRDLLAVVVPNSVLSIGGTLNDGGRSIAVDTAGNYYLAGGFRDTVDFDPGAAHVGDTDILTADGPQRDIFVAKYHADGSLDWARRFGGAGSDNEWLDWLDGDVQVDADGNTYVLCDFYGMVMFGGDPSFGDAGAFTFTSDSTTDHVMLRFDTDGSLEWATWFGGAEVGGFALDGNGSVYVAGAFTGTRQFGSEQLTAISAKIGPHRYNQDGFLSRLDADTGALTWTKKTSGKGNEVFTSIAFDPSGSGSLYLPGYHRNEAVIGSTTFPLVKGKNGLANEGFVAKANLAGTFNWAKVIAKGATGALGATMVNGNVIVTGSFGGTQVDFGNIRRTSAQSSNDLYVARMDANGNFLWAVNAGGIAGSTTAVNPTDITSDAFGNVFVTGIFSTGSVSGSAQFGSDLLTSNGTSDQFVSQLNGATGQFLKSWRMGGPLNEYFTGGLTTDATGNLWVTGQFLGAADFPTGDTLNSVNDSGDIFLLRFSQAPPAAMSAALFTDDADNPDMAATFTQSSSASLGTARETTSDSNLLLLLPDSETSNATTSKRSREAARMQKRIDREAPSILRWQIFCRSRCLN
jgi:hypothetical protein